jgi:ribose transport system substrate-binding protein
MAVRGIRSVVVGVVAGLAGLLAGCSQQGSQAGAEQATSRTIKIGVSVPAADHGWTAGVGYWAQQAMSLYPNVQWSYATAQNPTKQVADVEDMMAKGIEGLVILCTESASLTPIGEKAHDRGVYIVNVDRGFVKPNIADIFLEGDNKAFGRKSAAFAVEKLGGKGTVVILEGIPCTVNSWRVESVKDVLEHHPGIALLAQASTRWDRQSSLEAMEVLLKKHSSIDAVLALDDDVALGAAQAIREAGREREMWITGGGGMKDVVKMIMDGDPLIAADFTYPPSMIATGIHLCVMACTHGSDVAKIMPSHLVMDVDVVTKENAERYYFPESVY